MRHSGARPWCAPSTKIKEWTRADQAVVSGRCRSTSFTRPRGSSQDLEIKPAQKAFLFGFIGTRGAVQPRKLDFLGFCVNLRSLTSTDSLSRRLERRFGRAARHIGTSFADNIQMGVMSRLGLISSFASPRPSSTCSSHQRDVPIQACPAGYRPLARSMDSS